MADCMRCGREIKNDYGFCKGGADCRMFAARHKDEIESKRMNDASKDSNSDSNSLSNSDSNSIERVRSEFESRVPTTSIVKKDNSEELQSRVTKSYPLSHASERKSSNLVAQTPQSKKLEVLADLRREKLVDDFQTKVMLSAVGGAHLSEKQQDVLKSIQPGIDLLKIEKDREAAKTIVLDSTYCPYVEEVSVEWIKEDGVVTGLAAYGMINEDEPVLSCWPWTESQGLPSWDDMWELGPTWERRGRAGFSEKDYPITTLSEMGSFWRGHFKRLGKL